METPEHALSIQWFDMDSVWLNTTDNPPKASVLPEILIITG